MYHTNHKLPAKSLLEKWAKQTPLLIFADFDVSVIPFEERNLPVLSVDLYQLLSAKIKKRRWINSFMEVSIIKKPVDWFAEQINGLVSIW